MAENIQLSLALCRIAFYTCFRKLCCKGPPSPRPEYDVVCIGLSGAGKSTLISRLCSEGLDGIVPTAGFSIKAVAFPKAVLNVKELGGFISSWIAAHHLKLNPNKKLLNIPGDAAPHQTLVISLENSVITIKKYFELEPLARGKRWIFQGSSINNMEAVRESFSQFISLLEEKELQSSRI
ncbi:ADP-ribosylation factor-like protein 15a isoform X4 [Ictalurus punctatus]|uniref:ADP-ribosylation factor-like protein 15a isoform X4 n=1 Tax=Ictalurus punctatus TaxID=7998 RepID=A0A2D0PP53_ICTPU|nr:ADP-ribosylation factor-like protein 15a isoform X4 [Ictalurus punctatus]